MSETVIFWAIGGAAFVLLAMIVVVLFARGMEKPAAKAAATAAAPAQGHAAMKMLFGAAAAEKIAAARQITDPKAARKGRAAVASVVASIAVAVGVAAAVRGGRWADDAGPREDRQISAGALQGTLLSPDEDAPVVLIVPGSGPTDRDGGNPLGVKANSYKLLAEALAEEGIASVRVDKRGMFGSAAAGDPNAVTVEAYAADYRAWIDAIRAERKTKCVWLLGHSEGSLMVSAAAEGRKDVCGLILVAGPGRKLGDVLRDQLQANPANAPLLGQALPAIAELEAGRRVDVTGMHPALLQLFAPQVQDFLISAMAVDPVELVRRAKVHTLVVQGTTDLQVSVEDAKLLNKAPATRLKLIKGMNHVLKEAPADRAANIATYSNPDLPLSPKLVKTIEDFIEDRE